MWSPHKHIVLGDDVGIGPNSVLQCDVEIGNKVLIAGNVAMVGSDDHCFTKVGVAMWDAGRGDAKKVVIEDDVWIGHGAVILSGARIGRGSIVGAGALIVGDVAPYSVMLAQKARAVRRRFTDQEIQAHEAHLYDRHG
jgi:acetyltransferase-like isoleucine patch superfamily enzyme